MRRLKVGPQMLKIATFNLNGVNGRVLVLLRWLEAHRRSVTP
jgi:hypothetical protein